MQRCNGPEVVAEHDGDVEAEERIGHGVHDAQPERAANSLGRFPAPTPDDDAGRRHRFRIAGREDVDSLLPQQARAEPCEARAVGAIEDFDGDREVGAGNRPRKAPRGRLGPKRAPQAP